MAAVLKILNSFEIAAKCASIICLILFVSWQFMPKFLFFIFGMENMQLAYFLGQRIAALFIGMAIILFFLAKEESYRIQKILALGFAISCIFLAISGSLALVNNIAGIGILFAIIVEIAFAIWFLWATSKISFKIIF
jgi:hypothetical protein